MMITHSEVVVTVSQTEGDTRVDCLVVIGDDGLERVERNTFIDGEHQRTDSNPSDIPDEVKKEIRRSVNRVASVQGKINRL